jgi:predicted transcriptional regulator
MAETSADFVGLSAQIVSAYVSKNAVPRSDLPALIASVHGSLKAATEGTRVEEPARVEPAVAPNRSVRGDHIVCLFDGKKFKSLRRHLRTNHNMSPEQYRATFGLRPDYPMVAPAYAKARSALAKAMGLGQKRRKGTSRKAKS